jgi:hypothetical protein
MISPHQIVGLAAGKMEANRIAERRLVTSDAHNPAAYAVVNAARHFRLGTASRKRTTSSELSTTGSFCGSRA